MDGREQLVLITDRTVGDEHDLAHLVLIPAIAIHQCRLQRRQHLRAAIGLKVRDEPLGAGKVLLIGRHSRREQLVHCVVKTDDVELVRRLQTIQSQQQAFLGLVHALATHRAGVVDHEDRLPVTPHRIDAHGGRVHHGQQIVLAIACLTEQASGRRLRRLRFPAQHEIAVRRNVAILQRDTRRVLVVARHVEAMRLRGDVGNRNASLQRDVEIDRQPQPLRARRLMRRMQHRRRDPVTIRHRVAHPNRAVSAIRRQSKSRLRAVARRDHQREARRPHTIIKLRLVLVFDLDRHRLARPDIGQRCREQVRPLFFHQARALSVGGGFLIDDARFLALLDVPFDEAITDHDLQRVDCCILGQGEGIDALHPLVGRVGETLGQPCPDDRPRDIHLHVSGNQRRLDITARRRRLQ